MKPLHLWKRSLAALAAAAAAVPLAAAAAAPASAGAAPLRSATTTSYDNATYLQDELGFSSSDTDPVVQPVTYDEFQWLLQQSGNYAFLIGDPAEDADFSSEAQAVEAAAKNDGASAVYWFDPNLSGGNGTASGTTLGSGGSAIHEPNLDIRNPSGITALSAASQASYGHSWDNLVDQYLGDGVAQYLSGTGTESAKVYGTLYGTTGTTSVTVGGSSVTIGQGTSYPFSDNDQGSDGADGTEIANGASVPGGGALYDYSSGSAPAHVSDSYFFVYNKANTVTVSATPEPQKIVNWIDLDGESSPTQIRADVTTAIGDVGVANLADPDQFDFWKSEVNSKEDVQASSSADGGDVPVLSGADDDPADGGWRVDQITYPELVDLLEGGATTENAVILFGGTWCPNTRPVLPFVNKYAQQNDVTVFNFDTVLDGGTTGGGTTSASNPLQSRNYVGSGGASDPTNSNPSFLYGDLLSTYLKNIDTQYNPTVGDGFVSYYPGGNDAKALTTVNKLQVPFLIGYQANASSNPDIRSGGGVTRQWIDEQLDSSGLPYYIEYMSDWWFTNPQPGELGLATIPSDASIWSTLDSELASVSWQTDPTTVDPNTAVTGDDSLYLDGDDVASLTFTPGSGTATGLQVASGLPKTPAANIVTISISPSALSAALSALGSSAPSSYAAATTALLAAYNASASSAQTTELETVVGAWGVAQQRKSSVTRAWGDANSPASLIGAANAIHALDIFFGGLPGGVVSTQTVTANPVSYGTAPQISVAITNEYERVPTSDVSVVVQQNGSTLATGSSAVTDGLASFTLPALAPGTYDYTVSYPGDSQLLPFGDTGSFTVSRNGAQLGISTVASVVPNAKTAGEYKVTIATPSGLFSATGDVTVKFTKGSITDTVTGELAGGSATVAVPKLTPGTWGVAISWAGDADYPAASWTGSSIDVSRIAANGLKGVLVKAPKGKRRGSYRVSVRTPGGLAVAQGKVTLKLHKGKTTRTLSGRLSKGRVTVSLPRLARGRWKVSIAWAGDANYLPASKAGATIRVKV